MMRRHGAPEGDVLTVQGNLASTYNQLGRFEVASQIEREVYFGRLKLHGEEHEKTLLAANNYASSLDSLQRFEEAKALFRKTMPVARRVFGEGREVTLKMRWCYARVLYGDPGATLDDLREAVETLVDVEPIVRRVLGGAHPHVSILENHLRDARAALRACETQPSSDSRDGDLDEVENVV